MGLKGKVKTMTRINEVNQLEGVFSAAESKKTIYHFNKKGRIKKIEVYVN